MLALQTDRQAGKGKQCLRCRQAGRQARPPRIVLQTGRQASKGHQCLYCRQAGRQAGKGHQCLHFRQAGRQARANNDCAAGRQAGRQARGTDACKQTGRQAGASMIVLQAGGCSFSLTLLSSAPAPALPCTARPKMDAAGLTRRSQPQDRGRRRLCSSTTLVSCRGAMLGHAVMVATVGSLLTSHAVTLNACKGLAVLTAQLQGGLSAQI